MLKMIRRRKRGNSVSRRVTQSDDWREKIGHRGGAPGISEALFATALGLVASDPARADRIDVKRVTFKRPRHDMLAVLDDAHPGLPVLVPGSDQLAPEDAQTLGGVRFVTASRRIIELLAERHGFPKVH
ncbi:DUF3088 family protein [Burkholderia sp. PU8-34]